MKTLLIACITMIGIVSFSSCNSSKSEAEKTAEAIKNATSKGTAGAKPVSETGTFVKATIDGKPWEATRMLQDASARSSYKLVHGEDDEISLNFNMWQPQAGNTRKLGDDMAINFWKGDDMMSGRTGEIVITSADDKWVEGTFYFTATQTEGDKKCEVTNGSFRIATTTPN
jgi:hypothetical protein